MIKTTHVDHFLARDKIAEEHRNRQYVLTAIQKLHKATTREILNQVNIDSVDHNENLRKDIESMFGKRDDLLSPGDKKSYFDENKRDSITMRTVQRAVKALNGLGIIYKNGRSYSLSPNAFKEMRYFADDFATPALSSVTYFPLKTIEQTLEELVVRYGVFIVFVFIEAARPINTNHSNDNIDKKNYSNHGYIMLFH